MLGAELSVSAVALRRRGGPPDWPQGAVALWLILGQSNAEGYSPWQQDPSRANPANAVPALTVAERAFHPWIRLSNRGTGPTAGQFQPASQGLATDASPRTSSKVWDATNPFGIPSGTQSFGPEIGLFRHVLSGGAPATWRDDSDPRLYILKQTEGGKSVDHFRWGGPGQELVLQALRQSSGPSLSALASAKTVLLQGVIFAIGDKDCTTEEPGGGGSMAHSLTVRFADWLRQVRSALGTDVPVAFVELETTDARKLTGNAQIEALAASVPNAAVIRRDAGWTDVGDGLHYDAAGMERMGKAFFDHFRKTYGRPGDGLVTQFPFTGLKPWFHVPPVFIDESATQMRIAMTAALSGTVHARVTAPGAPAPSPETIRSQSGLAGGFSRAVTADVEANFWTPNLFGNQTLEDCHFVLEGTDGRLGERVTVTRADGVRFAPRLTLVSAAATSASFTLRPSFSGTLTWSLLPGARPFMRRGDVIAKAFTPVQWGQRSCMLNVDAPFSISGIEPGKTYTLFLTGERSGDGRKGLTQSVTFTTP